MSGRGIGTGIRARARRGLRRAAALPALVLLACPGEAPPPARAPVAVQIEVARVGPLADRREYVGNVRSIDRIEIRARVRGYLVDQLFEDGARVAKGARLFRIDPRPFEVALAEAKGQLARAEAEAIRAERDLERANALYESGVVSPGLLDERRAARDATKAAEEAARAAVRAAELELSYADIRAPVAGRMGRAMIDEGNLVGESGQDTILAELVVEDPVRVYFAAPEGEAIPRVDGSGAASDAPPAIPVRILLGDGTPYPHAGAVDYVDPSVDTERGTLALRAVVPNPDGELRPGQFVRVVAEFPDTRRAVAVPQRAVLDEQGGSYVLLVGAEDKVERRPVTPGRMVDGRQEIRAGLSGGERVIVDGVQGVRPGDVVKPESVAKQDGPVAPDASIPGEPAPPGAAADLSAPEPAGATPESTSGTATPTHPGKASS